MSASPTGATTQTAEPLSSERSRIDDILVWRIAEDLRLAADQEDRFIRELRSLHAQRREVQGQMSVGLEAIRQLLAPGSSATEAQFEARLRAHREQLRRQQALQVEEIEIVRRIAGVRGLSRYLVVRSDLVDRMTQILAQPSSNSTPSEKRPKGP